MPQPAEMFPGLLVLWRPMWQCFQSSFSEIQAEWDGSRGGGVGVSISKSTVLIWMCEKPVLKFQNAWEALKSQCQQGDSRAVFWATSPQWSTQERGAPGQGVGLRVPGGGPAGGWWSACSCKEKDNCWFLPLWWSLVPGRFAWLGWLCLRQWKGLLFVVPLLGADSLPAFITHLKPSCFWLLTAKHLVKSCMKLVTETVLYCLILLCIISFWPSWLVGQQQFFFCTPKRGVALSGSLLSGAEVYVGPMLTRHCGRVAGQGRSEIVGLSLCGNQPLRILPS